MPKHPFHDVAIVGIHNTEQGRVLEGHNSHSITLEAVKGVIKESGVERQRIDGIIAGDLSRFLVYQLGIGPCWQSPRGEGIPVILDAAAAIATGQASIVLIAFGSAGVYTERESTAPWTRPANEFVLSQGLFTAAEFALIARRHMHMFGTTHEQMAMAAAIIRNNGHVHPDAIYRDRGPFTVDDIVNARMVADPYTVLECAMTSEGGTAMMLARADIARDLPNKPVYILGGASDCYGPSYRYPPAFDLKGRPDDPANGWCGKRASELAFNMAGLRPTDVDTCEFYDPFSFEILRQYEAFGFCGPGEGGPFVMDGHASPGGKYPVTTDGGLMAFSHGGATVQLVQRVSRGVEQLRGTCKTNQVPGASVSMATNGGPGALFTDVMLLGTEQP